MMMLGRCKRGRRRGFLSLVRKEGGIGGGSYQVCLRSSCDAILLYLHTMRFAFEQLSISEGLHWPIILSVQ